MKSIANMKTAIIALLMLILTGAGAQASTPWEVNPGDYRYDMSLYMDVTLSGAPLDYSAYQVGAFVGDECRGVGEVLALPDGREVLYLRARSNVETEEMTFRYRNIDTGEVMPVERVSFEFKSNSRLGYPSDPYILNIVLYYNVTVTAGEGGTIQGDESGRYAEGTALTFMAVPDEGHSFVQWSDGSTEEYVYITVEKDVELSAEFKVNKYKLTYMLDDAEYKTYEIVYGTAPEAEPAPEKEGYTFSGWEGLPETMPANDVTVYGRFDINYYKATFKVDNDIVAEFEVMYGEEVQAPDAPEKEGHTFAGWQDVPATMPAHDIEILGSYTVNIYKLNYEVDGELYKSVEVTYGSAIEPEAAPEKEGYTFSGWDGLPETMPANDVTVYGRFDINYYKATFKVDNDIVAEFEVMYGEEVQAPDAPEKEGHTFAGWQDVPATMPAHDIEILGSYTVNIYKLNYEVDGELYKSVEVAYGSAIEPEAAPEKEGYTFSGWEGLPETMPANDVTVYGRFDINYYKATFKVDNDIVAEFEVMYGEEVQAPDAPEKEGHTFAGWQDVPATMPAHDIEILGSYTVNIYKLNYEVDGELYKSVEVAYGSAIEPEAAPEKEGYTFSGWEGLPETMPAYDVTATGSFQINSYTVKFMIDEDVIAEYTLEYGAEIVAPEAPEKEGYTFAGWQDMPATVPAHDVVVYGAYDANLYKLNYEVDGELYKSVEVAYDSVIEPEAAPEKEGYTFSGWEGLPETMPAYDVTVTGSFQINSYTVKFMIDEDVIAEYTLEYGAEIVAPEAPEKEGYTFAGWQDMPATVPAHDVVVYGAYDANLYKLNYEVDGELYKSVEVAYGSVIEPEAAPEKEGYTFSGWEGLPETMPAYDVTVTGSFQINSYTVKFMIDEDVIAEYTLEYGAEIVAPEAPEKEGYTFAGWQDMPATVPAHDVVVYGTYEVNYYKLTVYLDDEVYMEEMLAYGAEIVIPEPELPETLKFDGWQEEIPATMPAHDVEIHGTTTNIDGIEAIFPDKNERLTVYTLTGHLICKGLTPAEASQRLSSGIYIVNGIKVLVK